MDKVIIGLTGAIASGKSLMSKHLKILGYRVFDADYEVHNIYNNPPQELIILCQDAIINNKINKNILRKLVTNNNELLKQITFLIMSILTEKRDCFISNNNGFIVIDAPTLFEENWDKICDEIICTYAPKFILKKRFLQRNKGNITYFEQILKNQLNPKSKCIKSNYIINTQKSRTYSKKQLEKILKKIKNKYNKLKITSLF